MLSFLGICTEKPPERHRKVPRTVQQILSEEKQNVLPSLIQESSESKLRGSSFGNSDAEQNSNKGLKAAGKQKPVDVEVQESEKHSGSKNDEIVHVNGRAMPKRLAELLAKDGTSSPAEPQAQGVLEQNYEESGANFYKDKLKELKKTTSNYYSSGAIKLGERASNTADSEQSSTPEVVCDKAQVLKSKSVEDKGDDSSNSVESPASQKSKMTATDGRQDFSGKITPVSPTVGMWKIFYIR